MKYTVKNAAEFDSAVLSVKDEDVIEIDGKISFISPIMLDGKKSISFIGKNDAMFDFTYPVSGFTETELNGVMVWQAEIPQAAAKCKPYAAFAADGTALVRPRLPKSGYYHAKGCPDFDMFSIENRTPQSAMIYGYGEVPLMKYPKEAHIRAFHWWTDEMCYIREIDYEKNIISFENSPIFVMRDEGGHIGARWYLDNVFEALNSAGEYFITPYCEGENSKIYYVPQQSDIIDDFKLYISVCEKALQINNCQNISFENITFRGSDRDKLRIHRKHSQAAFDIDCAVDIEESSNICFKNCVFSDIGLSCIGIDKGSHDVTIEGCELVRIGGDPIHIKGRNIAPSEWKSTFPTKEYLRSAAPDIMYGIKVIKCHIHDYGRTYYNACGIVLRYAYDCDLSDNEIHDGYYTGISVGWVWGYGMNVTNRIRVERNHIYNIGKRLLSDMGGIYTLGRQEGTVIRGNRVHNIEMNNYGGWGIYLDEGSSDILVENNIAYDVTAQPFFQHYGSENLLRKNIFAFGDGGAFNVIRKEEHISVILERNIFVSNGTAIYANLPENYNITDCMNLVWDYKISGALSGWMNFDADTHEYSFDREDQRTPEQMKEGGLFNGVIIADPKFADIENRNFTITDDSPAKLLGF